MSGFRSVRAFIRLSVKYEQKLQYEIVVKNGGLLSSDRLRYLSSLQLKKPQI